VAIPHIKIEGLKRMYGVLARLAVPVDYESPDEKPVDIIFMLLAPADSKTTEHLKALAQISRFLKDDMTCKEIRACCDNKKIATLLMEWVKTQAA
jgi:PTS system nitrogen regulatory IIA component